MDKESKEYELAAIEFLAGQAVNSGLEFSHDGEGKVVWNIRVLPWRSSGRNDVMILAGGYTIEQAICYAVEELADSRWIGLNWRVRMSEPGVYAPSAAFRSIQGGRSELERLTEDFKRRESTDNPRNKK